MQKEITAHPHICLGDCEAMNRRHPSVSNPNPTAHLKFFGGEGELLTFKLYRILFKKICCHLRFDHIFQYSTVSRLQWYRLKSKSHKTFDIIMSTKSVFLNFEMGVGAARLHSPLPLPPWVQQCPKPSECGTGMLNTRPLHSA
jgi:hypothetical protein